MLRLMFPMLLVAAIGPACASREGRRTPAEPTEPEKHFNWTKKPERLATPVYGFRVMPVYREIFFSDHSVAYLDDTKVPTGLVLGQFMPFALLILPVDARLPELHAINEADSAWECQFRFKSSSANLVDGKASYIVEVRIDVQRDASKAACNVQAEIEGETYTGTIQRQLLNP